MQKEFISLENIHFKFNNADKPLFSGLEFAIKERSLVTILGQSGCGKTTLLNILAGYLAPYIGKCYLGGKEINEPDISRIPIFQEDGLFPWLKAYENVALSTIISKGKKSVKSSVKTAKELLDKVGINSKSYNKYLKELSTGMKKRIELARALFVNPKVILADEPFANIDVETQDALYDLILSIWREEEMTIVFSTHKIEEALYLASEIIVLNTSDFTKLGGVFINNFQGKKFAIRENPKEYFSFYDRIRSLM